MPAASSIEVLPVKIVRKIDSRLRAAAYGDLDGTSAWLGELGYQISRSSLGRYVIRLRQIDAQKGQQRALMRRPGKVSATYATRCGEIALELSRLQRLQDTLLAELTVLNGPFLKNSVAAS